MSNESNNPVPVPGPNPVPPSVEAKPSVPAAAPTPAPVAPSVLNTVIEKPIDRRTFIKWSAVGWTCFAAIMGGYATMIMRFLFPNVLFEPVQNFRAGYPDEYSVGEISERWKENREKLRP